MPRVEIEIRATGVEDATSAFRQIAAAAEGAGTTMRRIFETATGVQIATTFQDAAVQVAAFAKELIQLGLETNRVQAAFATMTRAVGVDATALTASIEKVGEGLINITDVMPDLARLLTAGFKSDQIVEFTAAMKNLSVVTGKDVNTSLGAFTQFIITGNERVLGMAQGLLDSKERMEQFAAATGKSTADLSEYGAMQLRLQSVLALNTKLFGDQTNVMSEQQKQVQTATVAWEDFRENLAGPLVNTLIELLGLLGNAAKAATAFGQSLAAMVPAAAGGSGWLAALRDGAATAIRLALGLKGIEVPAAAVKTALTGTAEATQKTATGLDAITKSGAPLPSFFKTTAEGASKTADDLKRVADEAKKAADEAAKIDTALAEAVTGFEADILEAGWKRIDAAIEKASKTAEAIDQTLSTMGADFEADTIEAGFKRIDDAVDAAWNKTEAIDKALATIGADFDADVLEAGFKRIDDSVDKATKDMEASAKAAREYNTSLAVIGATAALLGDDFDAASANIAAMRGELNRLLQESQGQITPAIEALGTSLREALADQALTQAFEKMFLSVTDTFTKMADAMIAGTLDIEEAFANLGRSLLTNFVQIVLHEVFDPLLKAAASFVKDLVGTILSGLQQGLSGLFREGISGLISGAGGGAGGLFGGLTGAFTAVGTGLLSSGATLIQGFKSAGDIMTGIAGIGRSVWATFDALKLGAQTFTFGLSEGFDVLTSATYAFDAANADYVSNVSAFGQGLAIAANAVTAAFAIYGAVTAKEDLDKALHAAAAAIAISGIAMGGVMVVVTGVIAGLIELGLVIKNLISEDWELIHQLRAQQRTRTATTALGETAGRIVEAASLAELQANLQKAIIGTASKTGDVLLQMARDARQGIVTFEGDLSFTLPPEVAQTVISFLEKSGFTGAEFDSGRVNSIRELIAATGGTTPEDIQKGIEQWQSIMAALAAIVTLLETAEGDVAAIQAIDFSAVRDKPAELAEALKRASFQFVEAVQVAGLLEEVGFTRAADKLKQDLADLMATFGDFDTVLATIKDTITEAALQDPTVLMQLLDMTWYQHEGEKIEDTTKRVGESLAGLGKLMGELRAATMDSGEALPQMAERLRDSTASMDTAIEAARHGLETALDPTDILVYAQVLTDLTMARYQMEIDAVTALVDILRTAVSRVIATANTIAEQEPFLTAIGINIADATQAMIDFTRTLGIDVPTQLEALGAAMNLFIAQARQALAAGGGGIQSLLAPGGDLLRALEEAFQHAMELTDPGARLEALNTLLGQMGAGFQQLVQVINSSTLTAEQREAALASLTAALGPLGQQIFDALMAAAVEQAAQAAAAAEELNQIIGDDAHNVQNFMALKIGEMTQALEQILGQIEGAIRGLSEAGFGDIAGILDSILSRMPPAQTGIDFVKGGAAVLHPGEMVLNAAAADRARSLGISNASLTMGLPGFQQGTNDFSRAGGGRGDIGPGGAPLSQPGTYHGLHFGTKPGSKPSADVEGEAYTAYVEYLNALSAAQQQAASATGKATDAILEMVQAIGGAASAISRHADLLAQAGIGVAGLSDTMFAWSATLPTLDQQLAALQAAQELLAAEMANSADAWGVLVRVGPHALHAIREITQSAMDLADADPQAKLAGLTAAFDAIASGIKAAQQALSESFNRMRQAREEQGRKEEEALDKRRQAIDEEISALQDLVDTAEAWADVAKQLEQQLLDLRTGPLGSPNPSERFAAARTAYQEALAAYRASPTAEGAARVSDLGRALLEAASEFMTRPSPEYQALFKEITDVLEDMLDDAKGKGVSTEDLLDQIKTLEAESKALDEKRNAIQEATRAAIEKLNADEKTALAAVANTFSAELAKLKDEMVRVGTLAAAQEAATRAQGDHLSQVAANTQKTAAILNSIANGLGGVGYAQEGAWETRSGLYRLHQGEMVLPKPVATGVRAGASVDGQGGGVHIQIGEVKVSGTREGARDFFSELEKCVEKSMRFGTLHRVLLDQVGER